MRAACAAGMYAERLRVRLATHIMESHPETVQVATGEEGGYYGSNLPFVHGSEVHYRDGTRALQNAVCTQHERCRRGANCGAHRRPPHAFC